MEIQEWRKGNESTLTSMDRLELHNLWLKEIHKKLKEEIEKNKPQREEEILLGGFED